jgi:hypothetical protein
VEFKFDMYQAVQLPFDLDGYVTRMCYNEFGKNEYYVEMRNGNGKWFAEDILQEAGVASMNRS